MHTHKGIHSLKPQPLCPQIKQNNNKTPNISITQPFCPHLSTCTSLPHTPTRTYIYPHPPPHPPPVPHILLLYFPKFSKVFHTPKDLVGELEEGISVFNVYNLIYFDTPTPTPTPTHIPMSNPESTNTYHPPLPQPRYHHCTHWVIFSADSHPAQQLQIITLLASTAACPGVVTAAAFAATREDRLSVESAYSHCATGRRIAALDGQRLPGTAQSGLKAIMTRALLHIWATWPLSTTSSPVRLPLQIVTLLASTVACPGAVTTNAAAAAFAAAGEDRLPATSAHSRCATGGWNATPDRKRVPGGPVAHKDSRQLALHCWGARWRLGLVNDEARPSCTDEVVTGPVRGTCGREGTN